MAALGATALISRPALPQVAPERKAALTAPAMPLVCAYSQNLAKVPYPELGSIAQQIGYDGVDLTVREGGHVSPRILNVDLVRAIESVVGTGLEVPMITTDITSPGDPAVYPILAITGRTSVHMYRLGLEVPRNLARRAADIRNELISLVVLGQRCNMMALVSNHAGGMFGESVSDAMSVVNELDPRWLGFCFDPSQTDTAGWETGLRQALPRLRAVAVQDFGIVKNGTQSRREMRPLGEGSVDWARFFRALADAKFSGPLTLHREYKAQDELSAMSKDLEFVRKQMRQAWAESAAGTRS